MSEWRLDLIYLIPYDPGSQTSLENILHSFPELHKAGMWKKKIKNQGLSPLKTLTLFTEILQFFSSNNSLDFYTFLHRGTLLLLLLLFS